MDTLDRTRLYKLAAIFVALLSIFVFVKILGEARAYRFIGSNPEMRSAITVTGKGEVLAIPNIATFTFGATAEAKTAVAAQQSITSKLEPVMSYLKEKGIEDKDIKTVSYNVSPKYKYETCSPNMPCPSTGTITGYEATELIEVKVRNTDLAGEIISGVTAKGANNVSGINFSVDNEDSLVTEARGEAINDAKSKAMELAKELDVKLVRITEFSENGVNPIYYKGLGSADSVSAPAAAPLPAGENKITSQVTITYEIR